MRTTFAFAAFLALLAASPADAHRPLARRVAAGPALQRLPAAVPTTGSAGQPGQVMELGRGFRLSDIPDADRPGRRQTLLRGTWPITSWTTSDADGSHVLQGWRLGRDVLLATRHATSNGIGFESWTLAGLRLPAGGVGVPGAPFGCQALDFGPDAVRAVGGRIQVLTTDWVSVAFGPRQGQLQYTGAWHAFDLDGGRLLPAGPWVARPYLFSFERERNQTMSGGARPAYWLRASKAGPFPGGDPRVGPEVGPRSTGRVARVAADAGGVAIDLSGAPRGATALWLVGAGEARAGRLAVNWVAEGGRLMPPGYVPADESARWRGRSALLTRHVEGRVLWLGGRR